MKARKALARKEVLFLEGAMAGTSDNSVENAVGSIIDIESRNQDHAEDHRPQTPPPKSPGFPQPQRTPQSVPLPQIPGASPKCTHRRRREEASRKGEDGMKEQIAKEWNENFQAWLKKVPEGEED